MTQPLVRRTFLGASIAAVAAAWSPEARAIFEELGLEPGVTARRSLAESETFRALLAEPVPVAAEAA